MFDGGADSGNFTNPLVVTRTPDESIPNDQGEIFIPTGTSPAYVRVTYNPSNTPDLSATQFPDLASALDNSGSINFGKITDPAEKDTYINLHIDQNTSTIKQTIINNTIYLYNYSNGIFKCVEV